jgi:hypothetical protein
VIWTEFMMKCVPEYYPVQQRWVARPPLLRSAVVMGWLMIAHRYWQSSSKGPLAHLYSQSSSNGPLACHYCGGQWRWVTKSERSLLLRSVEVRVLVVAVCANSNRVCATRTIVAMVCRCQSAHRCCGC